MLSHSINELVDILKDYEQTNVNYNDVLIWLKQFELFGISEEEKKIIVDDLIKVLKITYFSKSRVIKFLKKIINENLEDIKNNSCSFLDIQSFRETYNKSESQKEYVNLLQKIAKEDFNLDISLNDFSKEKLIYIDDYLLTGGSFSADLDFISKNTTREKIKAYFLVLLYEEWNEKLKQRKHDLCDNLYSIFCEIALMGYFSYYIVRSKQKAFFEYDNITKEYFIKANEYIVSKIEKNKNYWNRRVKSMFISAIYRNIPNNAPICLWWGDKEQSNIWFPLLERKSMNYIKKNENRNTVLMKEYDEKL